jgi:hypothetical protein
MTYKATHVVQKKKKKKSVQKDFAADDDWQIMPIRAENEAHQPKYFHILSDHGCDITPGVYYISRCCRE